MTVEYKPSWKSFYKEFMLMLLVLLAAGAVHYFKAGDEWLKWLWAAALFIDAVLLVYVIVKRGTMLLVLRDMQDSPANQEVAFITCNPLKPFSSDFRKSVEIGLANVMHIEVGQNLVQTILKIGDIIITSSGTSGEEIRAKNIPNPYEVRDKIQEHARHYTMGGVLPPK